MSAGVVVAALAALALLAGGCRDDTNQSGRDAGRRGDVVPQGQGANAPDPTAEPRFSGEGSTRFCELARGAAERTPAQTAGRAVLQHAHDMMSSLAAAAPAEIKADARTMASAYADLHAGARKDLDDPKVRTASHRLTTYYEQVCGLAAG